MRTMAYLPSLPMSWQAVPAERAIAPLARLELDGVDERTDGDVGEGQSVARLDVGVRTGHEQMVSDLRPLGARM